MAQSPSPGGEPPPFPPSPTGAEPRLSKGRDSSTQENQAQSRGATPIPMSTCGPLSQPPPAPLGSPEKTPTPVLPGSKPRPTARGTRAQLPQRWGHRGAPGWAHSTPTWYTPPPPGPAPTPPARVSTSHPEHPDPNLGPCPRSARPGGQQMRPPGLRASVHLSDRLSVQAGAAGGQLGASSPGQEGAGGLPQAPCSSGLPHTRPCWSSVSGAELFPQDPHGCLAAAW